MIKKIWALILSCVLVFTTMIPCFDTRAAGAFTIQGSTETVEAGKQVMVDIKLENNPGISVIILWYEYDDTYFTLTGVENRIPEFKMTSGKMTIWERDDNCTENCTLATLTFDVAANTPPGEYPIYIKLDSASNAEAEEVIPETRAATIKVEESSNPVSKFLGGSLRIQPEVDGKANLRFGYEIKLPNDAKNAKWYWNYSVDDPENLSYKKEAENWVEDKITGIITSNLVMTNIPEAHYETPIYARLTVTYELEDGSIVSVEDKIQMRTVAGVAEEVYNDNTADQADKDYAEKILKVLKKL